MKLLTKKKLERLEKTNYYEGMIDGINETVKTYQKELQQKNAYIKGSFLQIAESLEELRKINEGNGIKTKKQKQIDSYIKELEDRILENREE